MHSGSRVVIPSMSVFSTRAGLSTPSAAGPSGRAPLTESSCSSFVERGTPSSVRR